MMEQTEHADTPYSQGYEDGMRDVTYGEHIGDAKAADMMAADAWGCPMYTNDDEGRYWIGYYHGRYHARTGKPAAAAQR